MNEQYEYIWDIVSKMIPNDITGRKRVNCKSNIRIYLKDRLNIKLKGRLRPLVHSSIRNKIEELLIK